MDFKKFQKGKTYCKHPLEHCMVRTVPAGNLWDTYIRFSGEEEYQPKPGSNIVLEVELSKEPEWITEKEYYAF